MKRNELLLQNLFLEERAQNSLDFVALHLKSEYREEGAGEPSYVQITHELSDFKCSVPLCSHLKSRIN